MSGRAEAVRKVGSGPPQRLLALDVWASFGERALLKEQKRFAGIRATSHTLKCLTVSKAAFEKQLGAPLAQLLPGE